MSKQELDRAEVVALVWQKRMTQRVAAEQLVISERQLRRIQKAYEPSTGCTRDEYNGSGSFDGFRRRMSGTERRGSPASDVAGRTIDV